MPLVKVNFQFSLPDEREEFDALHEAPKVRRGAEEFADWLRAMDKHTDEKFWPPAADFTADARSQMPKFDPVVYGFFFDKIRAKFWQCLEDEGATLD